MLSYLRGIPLFFSSRIIPGNEKKLYKMHNALCKKKINVISEENAFVHVSGHPGRDEMKDMYQWMINLKFPYLFMESIGIC